jgi:flagellar biosynthesis/type III secretory pathway M-ring protein FliF/YscJ
MNTTFKYIIGLIAAVAIVGGIIFWSRSSSETMLYGNDTLVGANTPS